MTLCALIALAIVILGKVFASEKTPEPLYKWYRVTMLDEDYEDEDSNLNPYWVVWQRAASKADAIHEATGGYYTLLSID